MIDLTYKNHFKFGYNNEWFRFRESSNDIWSVGYGSCERNPNNFKEECYQTAKLIYDTSNQPLTILFSGGIDSEMVVKSFHDIGINFKIAICQFSENMNIHDVSFAVVCCEQLGLKYDIIELDIKKFFDNDVYDYAESTQSVNPQHCVTMWLADQIEGMPIIGGGECHIVKDIPSNYVDGLSPYEKSKWFLYERETTTAPYRHFMIPGKERKAVPGFFQYTPEIMLSFMKDHRVKDLVDDKIIGKRSTLSSKTKIHQKYFSLTKRNKYTVFDIIGDRVKELQKEFYNKWPKSTEIYRTEYHEAIKILEGNYGN